MYNWQNTDDNKLLHYYKGCARSAKQQNDTKEYKKYKRLIEEIESRKTDKNE